MASREQISEEVGVRVEDLKNSIKFVLASFPAIQKVQNDTISLIYKTTVVCKIIVGEEAFKIADISEKWAEKTNCHCEMNENGTWYYYVDTIDECLGEIKRMFEYNGIQKLKANDLFENQVEKYQLTSQETWKQDMRPLMKDFFAPLFVDKPFYFENSTEKTKNILNLFSEDGGHRLIGFECLKSKSKRENHQEIFIFFDKNFYEEKVNGNIDLGPEKEKEKRKQPHFSIGLEQLWNVMCIITGNSSYMFH